MQSKLIEKKLCVGAFMLENSRACVKNLWSAIKLEKRKRKVKYIILLSNSSPTRGAKLYVNKHSTGNLFEKMGMDKIQYIKTYNADTISKFTNSQIQTIIDHFTEKPNIKFTESLEEQDDFKTDSKKESEV
jgi:hypothetical protein